MNEIQFYNLTNEEKNNFDKAIASFKRIENIIEKSLLSNEFVNFKYGLKDTSKRNFYNAVTSNMKHQIQLSPQLYSNKYLKYLANFKGLVFK